MSSFKELLLENLKDKPEPLFIFDEVITPAASIWVGVREWVNFFRINQISKGDRVILSLDESNAFIHILMACLWEGITIVLLRKGFFESSHLSYFDAKLVIMEEKNYYSYNPNEMGLPSNYRADIRYSKKNYSEIALILKSSGSTGKAKFICLSEKNILSVLTSHKIIFSNNPILALSSLPWTHSFGLILDLLLLTFNGNLIFRDKFSGKNLDHILTNFEKYNINHFSTVPILIEKILKMEFGKEKLLSLNSGLIGGAPISKFISDKLKNSKLRVGYGQSEAAPGICLGEIGKFEENYIGKVIGTNTRINIENVLEFSGENKFLGYYTKNGFEKTELGFFSTGDIVKQVVDEFYFKGRIDFSFKLPTGILISPEVLENEILELNQNLENVLVYFKEIFFIFYFFKIETNIILPKFFDKFNIKLIHKKKEELILSPKGELNRKELLKLNAIFFNSH